MKQDAVRRNASITHAEAAIDMSISLPNSGNARVTPDMLRVVSRVEIPTTATTAVG